MYLSGWSSDMYMLYPATLCLLLMCMIYIYYQRSFEIHPAAGGRIANLYKGMERRHDGQPAPAPISLPTPSRPSECCWQDTKLAIKVIFTFQLPAHNLDCQGVYVVPFDKAWCRSISAT